MSDDRPSPQPTTVPPPSKHQLALMIWVAVFPTLTLLNLVLGGSLQGLPLSLRTLILATIAVPIVIYGLMPHPHRLRARLIVHRNASCSGQAGDHTGLHPFRDQPSDAADGSSPQCFTRDVAVHPGGRSSRSESRGT